MLVIKNILWKQKYEWLQLALGRLSCLILSRPLAQRSVIYNIQIMSDSSNLDADRPKLANFRAT